MESTPFDRLYRTALLSTVRRTQAERRAATRAALLDATIELLVESGHTNLTTHDIARRAGVTRGAMAHYFTSKADLLVQALDHLAEQLATEMEASMEPARRSGIAIYEDLLDRLWLIHCGPLFTAAIELWVAARTDSELRLHLRRFEREMRAHMGAAAVRLIPEVAGHPRFADFFVTVLAAMRGLAMLRFTASEASVERSWGRVRGEILLSARQALRPSAAEVSDAPTRRAT